MNDIEQMQATRDGDLWIVSQYERWWTVSADESLMINETGRVIKPTGPLGRHLYSAVQRAKAGR